MVLVALLRGMALRRGLSIYNCVQFVDISLSVRNGPYQRRGDSHGPEACQDRPPRTVAGLVRLRSENTLAAPRRYVSRWPEDGTYCERHAIQLPPLDLTEAHAEPGKTGHQPCHTTDESVRKTGGRS